MKKIGGVRSPGSPAFRMYESVRNNKSLGVVWIRAALNDGNPECWKGEDEIERSTNWVKYYIPGLEQHICQKK